MKKTNELATLTTDYVGGNIISLRIIMNMPAWMAVINKHGKGWLMNNTLITYHKFHRIHNNSYIVAYIVTVMTRIV